MTRKPVVVEFTAPEASSDSGWLLLREVDRKLRKAWPNTRLIVRADSSFVGPDLCRLCGDERVGYVFWLAHNPRLTEELEPLMAAADELHCPQSGLSTQLFTATGHGALARITPSPPATDTNQPDNQPFANNAG